MKEFNSVLVTGGMGFIGSNFIRYMIKNYPDYSYINFDKLTYAANPDNLKDLEEKENYEFIKGDICDSEAVWRVMEERDVDAIVHFAAESHVDRAIQSAGEFIRTNVYGSYVMLQAALKYDIKKFVMISTDEVYGDIPYGRYSKEEDVLLPRNPYAASKAGADRLAYSFHETHGLPVVIARPSNNYGPYQHPEKLIPLFITNLLEDKKVPLYGDGQNIRDWLFVEDNCKALSLLLHKGRDGEVYNIAGENEKKNIEITLAILEMLGKDESMIEYVEDRKGHDRRYAMDCSKIKKEVGWKAETDFERGLRKTVDWYIKNKDWWKKLK